MKDTIQVLLKDSLRISMSHAQASIESKNEHSIPYSLIIPAVVALSIALLTNYFTRKTEIAKIKTFYEGLDNTRKLELEKLSASQEAARVTFNNEIQKLKIGILNDSYKTLYSDRLEALKALKSLVFDFDSSLVSTDNVEVTTDSMYNEVSLKSNYIKDKLRDIIINYSHLFNEEINNSLKSLFVITKTVAATIGPDKDDYSSDGEKIYNQANKSIALIEKELLMNGRSISDFLNS
jgi:hypothetical protein